MLAGVRVCVCEREREANMGKHVLPKDVAVFDWSVNHWAIYYSNWIIATVQPSVRRSAQKETRAALK